MSRKNDTKWPTRRAKSHTRRGRARQIRRAKTKGPARER